MISSGSSNSCPGGIDASVGETASRMAMYSSATLAWDKGPLKSSRNLISPHSSCLKELEHEKTDKRNSTACNEDVSLLIYKLKREGKF